MGRARAADCGAWARHTFVYSFGAVDLDKRLIAFDFTFFAFAIPAGLFAGISKGGFGSGASFAGATILAVILDPALALGLMLPLLMLIDVANLRPFWGQWDWRECKLIVIGGLPGVILGVVLFQFANADVLRFLIGTVALAFVVWQISQRMGWTAKPKTRLGPGVGIFAGATAGFTSYISHAGGPPVAVYLLSQGLGKLKYQASSVLIFWAINIMKFVPYAATGVFTRDTWMAGLLLAPFAVIGSRLGVKAHHIVSEALFFRITYVLLTVTGCKLIWDALV